VDDVLQKLKETERQMLALVQTGRYPELQKTLGCVRLSIVEMEKRLEKLDSNSDVQP
jgi:hypothetical protein